MDNKTKKPLGIFNLLTILLCVLLVASIVFNVVIYVGAVDLRKRADALTDSDASMIAELQILRDVDSKTGEDLESANQAIDRLTAEAAAADETIASLQTDLDTRQAAFEAYQAEARADLAEAVQQGEDNLEAAQEQADAAAASLQAELDALQIEFDAYQDEAEAALAAAVQQGKDDLDAAKDQLNESIASLQADLGAPQDEADTGFTETGVPVQLPAATPELEPEAPAEETPELAGSNLMFEPEAVIATVNGQPVTGADVRENYQSIVSYYGEPDSESLELYYSVAMDQAITLKLIKLTAAGMGLDQFTQEELDTLYAASDANWQNALDSYVTNTLTEPETITDEEREAAYAEAESYYESLGYSQEILRENYLDDEIFSRVKDALCKDVAVTDDEVLAYFDEVVSNDRALYEFDPEAYETQMMMYQYGYADQMPWYRPAGYRYVRHILLPVDDELLADYTDLLALAEEEPGTETEPVTADEVEAFKANIIALVQPEIDEIYAKLAQGELFEDLIAEYGTDPGMTSGDYPDGYEVSQVSYGYVPEFVEAAFSVYSIGAVSEPYLSEYGVHIVQYVGDVPAGPVELNGERQASIRETLLEEKNNEVLDSWRDDADIAYTGVIRSLEEIEADEAE